MKLLMALRKRPILTWTLGGIALVFIAGTVLFGATRTDGIDSYAQCALAGNPISETEPPVCHDGSRYFVGPRSTPQPEALTQAVTNKDFEILVDGDSVGTYPREQRHIIDDSGWLGYWQLIHHSASVNPPLLPVNFTTNDVIAVSEGQQTTSGYSYKVTAVSTGSKGSIVDLTESIPTVTCPVADHPSNRYFIVRTAKLVEPVSYRTTTIYRHC